MAERIFPGRRQGLPRGVEVVRAANQAAQEDVEMATPVEETKAEEADVTEAEEEKEVVVLTDTEAEETEAEEAEAEEAEKTEPVSQEGK